MHNERNEAEQDEINTYIFPFVLEHVNVASSVSATEALGGFVPFELSFVLCSLCFVFTENTCLLSLSLSKLQTKFILLS